MAALELLRQLLAHLSLEVVEVVAVHLVMVEKVAPAAVKALLEPITALLVLPIRAVEVVEALMHQVVKAAAQLEQAAPVSSS